jgi:hypothetical protein
MDENVLARLLSYIAPQDGPVPPLEMFMRQPQGFALPPPQFSVQSSQSQSPQGGSPRFSGAVDIPAFGGTVGLSGDYQANQYGPGVPDWSAMARYRRQF